jgi:hypothetical protein
MIVAGKKIKTTKLANKWTRMVRCSPLHISQFYESMEQEVTYSYTLMAHIHMWHNI